MGHAVGGGSAFSGFLGGQWFPLRQHGALHVIGARHSVVWLTQASHVGIGAPGWGSKERIVIAIWSIPMGGVAGWAYRRDPKRV